MSALLAKRRSSANHKEHERDTSLEARLVSAITEVKVGEAQEDGQAHIYKDER